MLKLLFLSTPVGPLGSGLGGGVELTLKNMAQVMQQRGHQVQVVAPTGSLLPNIPLQTIPGNLQISMQTQRRGMSIYLAENSVLGNMWDYARQVQENYDLILNFAYDWLPFYLTPFFACPVAHLISMASVTEAMDQIIQAVITRFPNGVAFHSQAQAATFGITSAPHCLSNALDLSRYQFCEQPDSYLTWIGRISPEKGLEDAVSAAQITGIPLKILGNLQNQDYWQQICQDYPDAPIEYLGFLSTDQLQQRLRKSRALLMTHRWIEAFGNVAIEALACGVPVISYLRGGPAEIVEDGKTGFLVEPDQIMGLVTAINRLQQIDRAACRRQAETKYSLAVLGDRLEAWFGALLNSQVLPT